MAHLATAAGRRRAGSFLVEGPHAVTELLGACASGGRWQLEAVYATGEALARHSEVAHAAAVAGVDVTTVTSEVLKAMADADSPQGVLAVSRLPATRPVEFPLAGFGVLLVEVRDPGNVGTVIRAADAAGGQVVVLSAGCADVYAPKVVRSTAGSLFHLPVVTGAGVGETIGEARRRGWTLLATAADGAVGLDDPSTAADLLRAPHLWLLGNEAHGVPPAVQSAADAVVRIPIRGRAESLNLAMAATLVLFASAREAAARETAAHEAARPIS